MTAETSDLILRIDGTRPLSPELLDALAAVCDDAEDGGDRNTLIVHVSGTPEYSLDKDLTVAMVRRWERGLRRMERLPAATIAVASGECGGHALEALLATDYRIATASVRLLVSVRARVTWPGMALHRLVQQAGAAAVRRTVLFGVPIEAGEALAMSLVDELTDDTASALTAAARMAGVFPGAELAIRRQLMLDAQTASFEDALGVHLAACDRVLRRVSAGVQR